MESEAGVEVRFPLPPMQYVACYSRERVSEGTAPPPPPPIQGLYRCFGNEHNSEEEILPPLSALNIKTLYSSTADPRQELKHLNRSLVAAFLDLIEILVRCPGSEERIKKIEDLRLLFINIHHLVNDYRPRQARETLRVMMELQAQERTAATHRFHDHFQAVREQLASSLKLLPDDSHIQPSLIDRIKGSRPVTNEPETPKAKKPCDSDSKKDDLMVIVLD